MRDGLTIAVTGLNATDNPAPGVAVIRSLRAAPAFRGRVVGLAYDSLDPGLYCDELDLTAAFLVPYPSQGLEALRERLFAIHERVPFDVLMPTLDSELPSMIALEPELNARGVHLFVPSQAQFDLRSKARLAELGERAGLEVPETRVVSDVRELYDVHQHVPYPFMVKGVFYGALLARAVDEAVAAFHLTVAKWGLPVIVQKFYAGEEYDVVAVGDGARRPGGRGADEEDVPHRQGQGLGRRHGEGPLADRDDRALHGASRWRGPCEVEVLRDARGPLTAFEVNPRFPAWVYLSAGAGQNLPWAVAQLALGEQVQPMPDFRRARCSCASPSTRSGAPSSASSASPRRESCVRHRRTHHDHRAPRYERPTLIKHVAGMMNKFARVQAMRPLSHIDGVAIADLVAQYGSPLFVFSRAHAGRAVPRARDRRSRGATRRCGWPGRTRPTTCEAICRVFHREGAFAEVVIAVRVRQGASRSACRGEQHPSSTGPTSRTTRWRARSPAARSCTSTTSTRSRGSSASPRRVGAARASRSA